MAHTNTGTDLGIPNWYPLRMLRHFGEHNVWAQLFLLFIKDLLHTDCVPSTVLDVGGSRVNEAVKILFLMDSRHRR